MATSIGCAEQAQDIEKPHRIQTAAMRIPGVQISSWDWSNWEHCMQLRRQISTALAAGGGALSACAARPLGKASLAACHLDCSRGATPGPRAAPQNPGCSNAGSWLADSVPCLTERQQTTAPGRRKQRTELDRVARCKTQTRAIGGVRGFRLMRKAPETKAPSRRKHRPSWTGTQGVKFKPERLAEFVGSA